MIDHLDKFWYITEAYLVQIIPVFMSTQPYLKFHNSGIYSIYKTLNQNFQVTETRIHYSCHPLHERWPKLYTLNINILIHPFGKKK